MDRRGLSRSVGVAAYCVAAWSGCSSPKSSENNSAAGATAPVGAAPGAANVLQYHKRATRDGVYVDAAFTKAAAAGLHRDSTFNASIQGPTYAQLLYFEGSGPAGGDVLFAATEQNRVYALDAGTGAILWQQQLGSPAPLAGSGICGNIDPLGITGTPVIDASSRTLYLDAMTLVGGARRHLIHALSLDAGASRPGWPLDVSTLQSGGTRFNAPFQSQRGALLLVNGILYVGYGGHSGDCGDYHGWVVGVPLDNPSAAGSFVTSARLGGIWAPGGLASDGSAVFAATGNTSGASDWGHGEAVLRFQAGPVFSASARDYFTPSNWQRLDSGDQDVGGSGPVLIDVPGATPSALVLALGKNGVAYLLDRSNLGGVGSGNGTTGEGVVSARVASNPIINAAAAYTTASGTYAVMAAAGIGCPGGAGDLVAIRIGAAAPPQISVAWCTSQNGRGSPIVTTTDGRSDAIVWAVGAESSNRLVGFDGDTGQAVFAGGGAAEALANVRRFSTPIAAKGRIFIASDTAVYAFTTR